MRVEQALKLAGKGVRVPGPSGRDVAPVLDHERRIRVRLAVAAREGQRPPLELASRLAKRRLHLVLDIVAIGSVVAPELPERQEIGGEFLVLREAGCRALVDDAVSGGR